MNQETVERYWQEVQHITHELEPDRQFSIAQVIDYVNEHLPEDRKNVTKTVINYLRDQNILHPLEVGEGKERANWRYTPDDIRRILLIELLKTRDELSVQESKVWLQSFEETQILKMTYTDRQYSLSASQAVSRTLPPTPVSSAYSLLRNRVSGILIRALGFTVDGKVPADYLVAIRPSSNNKDTVATFPFNLAWSKARIHLESGKWFLVASDAYSKLYIYRDLQQLCQGRNEIARMLDKEEYSWYCISLQSIYDQHYDVILGLPTKTVKDLSNVIHEYESMIEQNAESGKPVIQLQDFPGLSTLLKTAFINQPDTKGGTPLAALVEIIATTSTLLDYCAVLVPEFDDNGKAKWLQIQEYNSTFPLDLADRRIDVGKFLSGWCYKYNQSIVVEPTVEKDPRIAFFEEEGSPVAAAAIPAIASDQHAAVGAIYVASRTKLEGEQKVFSEELLTCLEILGSICGDMIARDQIEIETVRSASLLSTLQQIYPFEDLKSLVRHAVDEALRGASSAGSIHRWVYLLTLNIQATSQDTITQWLCTQGIENVGKFLASRIRRSSSFPLPVGCCRVRTDRYAFAILCPVDLPEEDYKQKIAELEKELDQLIIGSRAPRFYLSAVTFRYEYEALHKLGQKEINNLVDDLTNRMDERLRAGLSLKRGHQYLYTAQPDQAASNFEDALRYVPNNWYALKHLAEARMLQGTDKSIDQAIENCRKALDLNPNYASAHCLLADCLSYQRQFNEALVHYEKAIALDNTRHSFLTRYGITLASMTPSEYQNAFAYLESRIPELLLQRQYLEDPCAEAIARFGQVRELMLRELMLKGEDSNSPRAQEVLADYYYYKGYAYLQASLIDEAIEDFIMGRKHSPESSRLAQAYGLALRLRSRRERSMI